MFFFVSIRYIRKEIVPFGQTGQVAFDDNGDRIFAEYDIINIQYGPDNNKSQVSVGQYFYPPVSVAQISQRFVTTIFTHFTFTHYTRSFKVSFYINIVEKKKMCRTALR